MWADGVDIFNLHNNPNLFYFTSKFATNLGGASTTGRDIMATILDLRVRLNYTYNQQQTPM